MKMAMNLRSKVLQKMEVPMVLALISVCLGGCNYREFEDEMKIKLDQAIHGQSAAETDTAVPNESGEEGVLVIHAGPENKVFDYIEGSMDFIISNIRFYSNIEEAPEDYPMEEFNFQTLDPENSGFVTMDVEVKNFDYPGAPDDGTINMSTIAINTRECDPESFTATGELVYVDQHGTGETDYWHFLVKPGETKTCKLAFLIQATDKSELKDYVLRGQGAIMGEYYEIPWKE